MKTYAVKLGRDWLWWGKDDFFDYLSQYGPVTEEKVWADKPDLDSLKLSGDHAFLRVIFGDKLWIQVWDRKGNSWGHVCLIQKAVAVFLEMK